MELDRSTVVLATLIVYKVVLIAIGVAASRRTKDQTDFFLAGRQMGPWVAALSASASSSSAWTLLGVSGAAYAWGLGALWLFPACVGGFLLNWFVLAPALRRYSHDRQALTATEVIAGPQGEPRRALLIYLASFIILFSLLFYVASQFQGSAKTFQSTFGMSETTSLLLGSAIIVFYTMIGGFWAVSLTDSLQGMVMAATAIILPVAALMAVGGPSELWTGLAAVDAPGFASLTRNMAAPAAIGFIAGLLGIGLGYPGQPHVVNRFMALRAERDVARGRAISICWAIAVYAGMLALGLCGRVLFPELADKEMVFLEAANQLFHPAVAGVMIAAVLSAIMSTADSQLLVAASAITHDLPHFNPKNMLLFSRLVVLALSVGAVLTALYGTSEIFTRVLFAWTAMGAAFGPLLLVTVLKGPVKKAYALAAMLFGFVFSVTAYSFPQTRGTWVERMLPFAVAFALAYWGWRRSLVGGVRDSSKGA